MYPRIRNDSTILLYLCSLIPALFHMIVPLKTKHGLKDPSGGDQAVIMLRARYPRINSTPRSFGELLETYGHWS